MRCAVCFSSRCRAIVHVCTGFDGGSNAFYILIGADRVRNVDDMRPVRRVCDARRRWSYLTHTGDAILIDDSTSQFCVNITAAHFTNFNTSMYMPHAIESSIEVYSIFIWFLLYTFDDEMFIRQQSCTRCTKWTQCVIHRAMDGSATGVFCTLVTISEHDVTFCSSWCQSIAYYSIYKYRIGCDANQWRRIIIHMRVVYYGKYIKHIWKSASHSIHRSLNGEFKSCVLK